MHIQEAKEASKQEEHAERLFKKYRNEIELLESESTISKVRQITPHDIYNLGSMLESWEYYRDLCEEDGTLAQLGTIPNIALDVITVAYGTSPLSTIASTQPIDEERGTVWFKDVVGCISRGNVTAGDSIINPTAQADTAPNGFAGDLLNENVGSTAATVLSYAFTLAEFPLRPSKVTVNIATLGLQAKDDGLGVLNGNGIFGTIDYTTGAIVINLAADPAAAETIIVTYSVNFEAAIDIPKIGNEFRSTSVQARIWALKGVTGIFQAFAMKKRFGMNDAMAEDLVSALNAELMNTSIGILLANIVGNTNFSLTAPPSVSFFEHKQTFKDSIANAESVMLGNAGRGWITTMVAGRDACALIETLPGFTKISDAATIGPHIFGTLDGRTVVRVPNDTVLAAKEIICIYKGPTPWEAPLVHAPFMPLVVTTALPTGTNPLTNQKAAASWAALESLIPNFSTKITLTP